MKKITYLWKRIFTHYAFLVLIAFLLVFATIYFTMSNVSRQQALVYFIYQNNNSI